VTADDLAKFEQFKRKFDPSFAANKGTGQGTGIKWPSNNNQPKKSNEDDDLYS